MTYKDLFEEEAKRTRSYQFTIDPRNGDDSLKYDALKREVADHNKANPGDKFKIKKQFRLGTDNPDAWRYHQGGDLHKRNYAGQQSIKAAHASRVDVYVHPHYGDAIVPWQNRTDWSDRKK